MLVCNNLRIGVSFFSHHNAGGSRIEIFLGHHATCYKDAIGNDEMRKFMWQMTNAIWKHLLSRVASL